MITEQLERYADQEEMQNGLLVADLLDLRAVESAAVIERAFAAGRVDEGVAGDWEEVQMELGLKARPECAEGSVNYDEPDVWEFDSDKEPTVPDEQAIAEAMAEEDEVMEAEVVPTSVAVRREGPKVGRNEPCPCGSGKKFKKCCGG